MTPRPKLLVVEDERPIVELLTALVTPLGVDLVAAATGREAIDLLETLRPAVVTLDLVLPDVDGFVVLDYVRKRRDLDDLPVVAITALADPATVKRAYAMGVSDFVAKPFNVDILDAKLRVFLQLRRLSDAVRERERFLDEVVEHLATGLMVCDTDGRVLRLNVAGAHQLGLPHAQGILGRLVGDVAPGAEAMLQLQEGAPQRRVRVSTPTGPRHLGFTTGPVGEGRLVIVFRDLSNTETRGEAERAARSFAHEVRNPLSAISAAAQVICRTECPPSMRDRLARAIDGEAQRIEGLVREYVERHGPEAPTGHADLRLLLEEIVEVNLLGEAARARVHLECDLVLPPVRADPRVKQVVLNLVQNAIAATDGGGTITVTASPAEDGVRLTVRDTGVGIAPEDLPRIFEEAFSTRAGHGEGLGLSIARRIIEEHGGTLDVESTRGEHTTFTVWLRAHS